MIRLEHVYRIFRVGDQEVHALADVSLSIGPGEYVCVTGPSGSGKSTLLNILGLLDRPTSGTYTLDSEEVAGLPEDRRARIRREKIGFVFQFFHLIPRLNARQNIELPLMLAGVPPPERRRRSTRILQAIGLANRAAHRPDQLSGGQRQRVAIGRAAVMEPEIILADEPTGNLDTASSMEVMQHLEDMNQKGLTLIVVTHDEQIARRASRRIRMMDGNITRDEPGQGVTR